MGAQEKQDTIDAWDKHVARNISQRKYLSFSSDAEAAFCEHFRIGVMAHGSLTKKEKLEILMCAKL
jgi:hypothetical protein